MKGIIVKHFSPERMKPIITEFKTREYISGITKRQVITERNLIYLANFRQQYVIIDIEGEGRMGTYDSRTWVAQEVEAYLYFEILNYTNKIKVEKIREQIYYRVVT